MNTQDILDRILAGQIRPIDCERFAEAQAADGWDAINARITSRAALRRRRGVVRGVAVAACIVTLIVGAVVLLPTTNAPITTSPPTAGHILPGRERAVLILESGEHITFDGDAATNERRLSALGIAHNSNSLDFGAADAARYALYAPRGGIFSITLADGTRVTLNSDTRLSYPGRFEGAERRVRVDGEAYFTVAKDSERPFVVEGGGMSVEVLGTEFNLLARAGGDVEATLVQGSVEVRAGDSKALLAPGYQARLSANLLTTAKVNTRLVTSWKDGMFEFNDMPLAEIAEKLRLWYDVDFVFADPSLRQVRFTGAFGKDNELSYFLDLLSRTQAVNHTVQGQTVTLTK